MGESIIQRTIGKFRGPTLRTTTLESGSKTERGRQVEGLLVSFAIEVRPRGQTHECVEEIKAGERYTIIINCEQSGGKDERETVIIKENFHLTLTGTFSANKQSALYREWSIDRDKIMERGYEQLEYEFEARADIATGELALSLALRDWSAKYSRRSQLGLHKMAVRGKHKSKERQEECNIAGELPENTAIVVISDANTAQTDGTYHLRSTESTIKGLGKLNTVLNMQPIKGIAQNYPKEKIVTIFDKLHGFARDEGGELIAWLQQFPEEEEAKPCLIIVDTTKEFEIAWELLEIETEEYLGIRVQIVRWYPFKPFTKRKMMEIKDIVYEGRALAYLDTGLEGSQQENEALKGYETNILESLSKLRECLLNKGSLTGVAVVYIACHGHYGRSLTNHRKFDPELQEVREELRAEQLARMPVPRELCPFIFPNTCTSINIQRKEEIYQGNFAENFLVRCAHNYIGTMAPVGIRVAAEVGKEFLIQAQKPEGVLAIEMLRIMREQAVINWKKHNLAGDPEKDFHQKRLFHISMYAYYGNPRARLRLQPIQIEREEKMVEVEGMEKEKAQEQGDQGACPTEKTSPISGQEEKQT